MNRYLQHFLQVFGINLVAAGIAAAVLLQADLQSCSTLPPAGVAPGTTGGGALVTACTIHWNVIAAAFFSALISGSIATVSKLIKQTDGQIASLQTATGTTPPQAGTAISTAPAPVYIAAAVPAATGPIPAQETASTAAPVSETWPGFANVPTTIPPDASAPAPEKAP